MAVNYFRVPEVGPVKDIIAVYTRPNSRKSLTGSARFSGDPLAYELETLLLNRDVPLPLAKKLTRNIMSGETKTLTLPDRELRQPTRLKQTP
mgnify:CR=1 FL=1